jgi:hypothetical protein
MNQPVPEGAARFPHRTEEGVAEVQDRQVAGISVPHRPSPGPWFGSSGLDAGAGVGRLGENPESGENRWPRND